MSIAGAGLDTFFASESSSVYEALPDGVRITFELTGPGGGTWTVARDEEGAVTVIRSSVRRPDCRLTCTVDDFVSLIRGDSNVRRAFLEERIDVRGDVGLVWRLQKVLLARQRT